MIVTLVLALTTIFLSDFKLYFTILISLTLTLFIQIRSNLIYSRSFFRI